VTRASTFGSLDIGCGFSSDHAKKGDVGIDLKKGLCDVVASACNLPFRDRSFDKIIMSHILEHLAKLEICLHEVRRVLIKGGVLEVEVPNRYAFWRFKTLHAHEQESKEHIHIFSKSDLTSLLSQFDFEICKIEFLNSRWAEKKLRDSFFPKRLFYGVLYRVLPKFQTSVKVTALSK
jgi:ubiquinone/menaquinone biosynthesis C-methylase UbiE